jgi:rhodanese-related sulfurtransferase
MDKTSQVSQQLRNHPVFAGMDDRQIRDIMRGARLTATAAGNTIPIDDNHVIAVLEGSVRIERERRGNRRCAIRIADQRNPALVLPSGDTLSVTALADCRWLQFDRRIIDSSYAWREAIRPGRIETPMPMNFPPLVTRTNAFRKLSLEMVAEAFRLMTRRHFYKGEDVIREGDAADAYYLLDTGSADVWQSAPGSGELERVRQLEAGDAFGEEALLQRGVRNATVRMRSDGSVLRLEAADFEQIVAPSMSDGVSYKEAEALMKDPTTELIDCRELAEYNDGHLPGARHVSLHDIRNRLHSFRDDRSYLVYCHHDLRSRAAVFILRERHINARFIIGGLDACPQALLSDARPA